MAKSEGGTAVLHSALRARTPAVARVSDYVRLHPRQALTQSTFEIADAARVSPSVVIRFVRELGLSGMQEFRVTLATELSQSRGSLYEEVMANGPGTGTATTVFTSIARSLLETADFLTEDLLSQCTDLLLSARRLELYGVGASGFVALDGAHKFARLNLPAWAYTDPHLQIMFASNLGPEDVVLAISHSGQTTDTVEAAQVARLTGAHVIALTSARESDLARIAHVLLLTPASESPAMLGAFTSRLLHLAVIDCLTVAAVMREPERLATMRSRASLLGRRKRPLT